MILIFANLFIIKMFIKLIFQPSQIQFQIFNPIYSNYYRIDLSQVINISFIMFTKITIVKWIINSNDTLSARAQVTA